MSQLERLAEAIVQVGKQSGPAQQSIARTQQAASRLAPMVPNDEAGYSRTIRTQLYAAAEALRDVERLLTDFDKQADAFAKRLVGEGAIGSASPTASMPSATTSDPDAWLSQFGLSRLDLNEVDLSDNPILGEFGRGGLTRSDYEWLVSAWASTVAPGVAAGKTRDDFVAHDERVGSPPTRRMVDAYDLFLTSDPIHFSRRPDGSIDIGGGRHRIACARALGLSWLPGKFH